MGIRLDGLFNILVGIGVITVLIIWGGWELIDWLWIDEAIKVYEPITPEIEIIVKDNVIDTLYIYRQP